MAHFFIKRPVFAWVLAILVMFAGGVAITQLPLAQYPSIAPPQIRIGATYTGASAETMEDSVTQILEQAMTGLDGLTYMSSTSSSDGSATLTLTFDAGTDVDTAQMQVQTKVEQAKPRLPESVQAQGISISNTSSDFLMIAALVSDNPEVTNTDISDYISSTLYDQISRLEGVGSVTSLGTSYAMRIWLDPGKLRTYALIPSDISTALSTQNTDLSTGQLGALPAEPGQLLNATITSRSKLRTVEDFKNVVIKSQADGATVLLGDVADIELGGESYDVTSQYNGRSAGGMGVSLATGANALDVSERVQAKLAELEPFFPSRLQLHTHIAYNTAPFVAASISEVVITLFEAIVLVTLVMYLFMQNLRATLIPTVAVPVVLLGTLAVLSVMGYSINTLTMFGMVLAIGMLVDDAIVVVENVERLITEQGLSPRKATQQSMEELSGALIGTTLAIAAVFIPMAFFAGSTGVIYRQFSVTMVTSMSLSTLVAFILTPAMCASLLKPANQTSLHEKGFFGWFNRSFRTTTDGYQKTVHGALKRRRSGLLIYTLICIGMVLLIQRLPTAFLPDEDQGILMAQMSLPVGGTDHRMERVMERFNTYMLQQPEVSSVMTIRGLGFGGNAQNTGRAFIRLKDWEERPGEEQAASAIALRANQALGQLITDANVFVMQPPAIMGLGQSSGFDLELQDLAGLGHAALYEARNQLLALAMADPTLRGVRTQGLEDTPNLVVTIDDRRASAHGVDLADLNDTLSTALGGSYVNDFVDSGRVKKVYVQGMSAYRMQPEDLGQWYVRNEGGEMVSMNVFIRTHWDQTSPMLERYNGFSAFQIVGEPASGVSSGVAMDRMAALVAQLPDGVGFEWTGQSYQERMAGNQASMLYAISIAFVFLCLAALYESWSIPIAVMLAVPLGIAGALLAVDLRGLSNDVYFQVGLLTTIGLAAKNAILIVEFARDSHAAGASALEAILQAVHLRFRPVLMTAVTFILGVIPLATSTGAGAGGRQAIGTGILGGVMAATVLGLFFTPLFYVIVQELVDRLPKSEREEDEC